MESYDLDSLHEIDSVPLTDELSLWSAPFGLRLLDVVHYRKQMRVLDIGCGFGFPSIELAMRLGKSSTIYGIDSWKEAVQRARRKISLFGTTNVEVLQGKAEEMPFGDGYFDLAVSNNGINNVRDIDRTFKELHRVSKPGAQFVFTFNTNRTFQQFYDVFHQVLVENGMEEFQKKVDEHVYAKRKPVELFIDLLERNGYRLVSMYRDNFSYRFSDGTAMLDHSFVKMALMPDWKEILPDESRETVFGKIEAKLNEIADQAGSLSMHVPFLIMNCQRL